MRTGATLVHSTPLSRMGAAAAAAAAASKTTFTPPATIQRSTWHSPVPYLFGGLAAMMGLIAFALLVLACSYWEVSDGAGEDGGERDVEGGTAEKGDGGSDAKAPPVFEEKFLVIMAGDVNPTFLATKTFLDDAKADGKAETVNEKDVTAQENGDEADVSLQVRR